MYVCLEICNQIKWHSIVCCGVDIKKNIVFMLYKYMYSLAKFSMILIWFQWYSVLQLKLLSLKCLVDDYKYCMIWDNNNCKNYVDKY
jgi:hypothetical protein